MGNNQQCKQQSTAHTTPAANKQIAPVAAFKRGAPPPSPTRSPVSILLSTLVKKTTSMIYRKNMPRPSLTLSANATRETERPLRMDV